MEEPRTKRVKAAAACLECRKSNGSGPDRTEKMQALANFPVTGHDLAPGVKGLIAIAPMENCPPAAL